MKKETIVLYNEHGKIIGHGSVNKKWERDNADGSTMTEAFEKHVLENPGSQILYLKGKNQVDISKHKVESGKVVDLIEDKVEIDLKKLHNLEARIVDFMVKNDKAQSLGFTDLKNHYDGLISDLQDQRIKLEKSIYRPV